MLVWASIICSWRNITFELPFSFKLKTSKMKKTKDICSQLLFVPVQTLIALLTEPWHEVNRRISYCVHAVQNVWLNFGGIPRSKGCVCFSHIWYSIIYECFQCQSSMSIVSRTFFNCQDKMLRVYFLTLPITSLSLTCDSDKSPHPGITAVTRNISLVDQRKLDYYLLWSNLKKLHTISRFTFPIHISCQYHKNTFVWSFSYFQKKHQSREWPIGRLIEL